MPLRQIYIAGNNKTHLHRHLKCPIFLSDFNEISNFFPLIFFLNPQHQISRKPVQWQPRRQYTGMDGRTRRSWTDGHDETERHSSQLRERAQQAIRYALCKYRKSFINCNFLKLNEECPDLCILNCPLFCTIQMLTILLFSFKKT